MDVKRLATLETVVGHLATLATVVGHLARLAMHVRRLATLSMDVGSSKCCNTDDDWRVGLPALLEDS